MKLIKGLLAIAIVSLIAVSCNETKKGAKEDLNEAVENAEKSVDKAVDKVDAAAADVKEAANDAVNEVEEVATDAAEEVKEVANDVKDAVIEVFYPKDTKLQNHVNKSMLAMTKSNPHVGKIFHSAYGYVIFPKITKGGFVVGGAGGHGLVFHNNRVIGSATLMQATVGAQIGGQQYSEYIFFENKAAMERFKNNKLKFAGEASAVALDKAVSDNIDYQKGVAVYTYANKGVMAEAALGAQKFKYKAGIK